MREEMVRVARSNPTANGYLLMSYPDCTTTHQGKYVGLTCYIVARNTADEKVFNRLQLAEASTYAKKVFGTIEAIATGELCDQAVIDAYENPVVLEG